MKQGLIALALLASAGAANASIIPTLSGVPTATGGGDFSWMYDATLASDQALLSGNYFTIYDFDGYTGYGAIPADWTVTTALLGDTPFWVNPIDDPSILNVTFTWTGPAVNWTSPYMEVELGTFELFSTYNQGSLIGSYSSLGTRNQGPSRGTDIASVGSVTTPLEGGNVVVPEPATWALLIAGFGMVGTAMRRRKVALAA